MAQTTQTTETGQRQQPNVERSLETTLRKFSDAFNRFDAKEVGSFWAEDGTVIDPVGRQGRGPSGVEKVFHEDADTMLRGTTSRFSITGVRKITGNCVLLDLDHDLQNFKTPEGATGTKKMHIVILAQQHGDGWQWIDVRPYSFVEPRERLH